MANACAGYTGSAVAADRARLDRETGWVRVVDFPEVRQRGDEDCGAAALSSVLAHFGRTASPEGLERELGARPGEGLRAGALAEAARRRGLEAFVFDGATRDLVYELSRHRPVIVGVAKPQGDGEWRAHYEVVVGLHVESGRVLTFDPARGLRENTRAGFLREWESTRRVTLVMFEREKTVPAAPLASRTPRRNATGAQPKMQTVHITAPIDAD